MGARPAQGSISMWIKAPSLTSYPNAFTTGNIFGGCGNVAVRFELDSAGDFAAVTGDDASCGNNIAGVALAAASFTPNQWHHVAATWDSSANTLTGYYDGALTGTVADSFWPTNFSHVQIGGGFNSNRYWVGQVDEVRMSTVNRSADWVATEYNNQSSPATFYSIGLENAAGLSALTPSTGSPGVSVTISGGGFGTATGTVTFNGQTATTSSWSDTSIVAVVPASATSGPVIVTTGGVASNSLNFAIFGYHRAVVIDNTKVANTDQTNFPVLISGTYTYLPTPANAGQLLTP